MRMIEPNVDDRLSSIKEFLSQTRGLESAFVS